MGADEYNYQDEGFEPYSLVPSGSPAEVCVAPNYIVLLGAGSTSLYSPCRPLLTGVGIPRCPSSGLYTHYTSYPMFLLPLPPPSPPLPHISISLPLGCYFIPFHVTPLLFCRIQEPQPPSTMPPIRRLTSAKHKTHHHELTARPSNSKSHKDKPKSSDKEKSSRHTSSSSKSSSSSTSKSKDRGKASPDGEKTIVCGECGKTFEQKRKLK